MTPAVIRCVLGALLLLLIVTKSEAYYYVYYVYPVYRVAPYYLTTPLRCTKSVGESCPNSYCYYSPTRNSCCMFKFYGSNNMYEQCTCLPGVCTVRPTTTTTTTTTTPTTTTPFVSLCPPRPTFRLLNSKPANECDHKGIAKVTWDNFLICNAVFAPATVNGVFKHTFISDQNCKNTLNSIIRAANANLVIKIGKQTYPITKTLFEFIDGPGKLFYLDLNPQYERILDDLGACQDATCPYNNKTMAGKVDFQDCTVASYGASTTAENLQSTELRQVQVRLNSGACKSPPLVEFNDDNFFCFRAVDNSKVYCTGDSGAPVYCKATTNKEPILVGVIQQQGDKCNLLEDFAVIKYQG